MISHNSKGVDISMRKDITIEKIMLGGEKVSKTLSYIIFLLMIMIFLFNYSVYIG